MGKPTFADLQQLCNDGLLPFYRIDRDIYVPPPQRRLENDAEHSWSVAMMACALAPEIDKTLDVGLVCQFAVLHDFTEIFAGDTSIWAAAAELQTKEAREAAALERITQKFAAFPWLCETLAAYERQDTAEAQFVRAIDKVAAILLDYLDECRYHRAKGMTLNDFVRGMQTHRKKAQIHAGAFAYYEAAWEAIVSQAEHFFQPSAAAEST